MSQEVNLYNNNLMCGLTGIYSKDTVPRIKERVEKMNLAIIHRGPDSGAFYVSEEKLALGHRRLSIIDLREVANQPMHSFDNEWHIVFNGEIYNFKEIKEQLNYGFISDSDTEVIIASVLEKGMDWFLNVANGMFAIALFNSLNGELYLVRDRLGIKPLYFFKNENQLVFASEIKAILSSGLVEAKFNENAVDEYLANRYIRAPYTFFEGIHQIEPGSYHIYQRDLSFTKHVYWDIPGNFNTSIEYDEDNLKNQLKAELEKAIKYRLIS
ncbi:MAG: asparagine synthetase B, partial [Allomuricauda sp.]